MTEQKAIAEAEARELAARILKATGYPETHLEAEELEHGWKLFAGDDEGAIRVTIDMLDLHRYQFETLKMWWAQTGRSLKKVMDWLYFGQSAERPGGHLLWTPVLKARSLGELEAALTHAQEMRELMLERAKRRGLDPTSCRLVHMVGRRLSGYGETSDGLSWSAEARDQKLKAIYDSAPLWAKLMRPFRKV